MKKASYRLLVELTSNKLSSYFLKKFTASRVSKCLNKSFVKVYTISEDDMEKPLSEYKSLQDLFTRRLKAGVREIDQRSERVVSPVDGIVAKVGTITDESSFKVKGQRYTLHEMLGSESKALQYRGGTFVILYLSPSHYHRIHSPLSGNIIGQWSLGSKSYPVNHAGLTMGKRPLSRNYRTITELENHNKCLAIVKVGAMNVNSIQVTLSSDTVTKGEELGYFTFGSTVILLAEKGTLSFDESIKTPMEIKVGESIGILQSVSLK